MIDISFIILTWNSEGYIEKCIHSITKSFENKKYDFEIIIIDNGSSDETLKRLERIPNETKKDIHLITLDENKGTTYSRNLGLKRARGRYLCIMDSDVYIEDDVFDELLPVLESDESIGLIVPKILYPSGKWQKSIDKFPTFQRKVFRFFRLKKIEDQEGSSSAINECMDVDYAISAFWLFKKEIIQEVGLLDENIFYAPEDADYCLRVWKCGYRIVYAPRCHVVHHTQEISRGIKLNRAKIEHLKGLLYFFVKHKYLFRPNLKKANNNL